MSTWVLLTGHTSSPWMNSVQLKKLLFPTDSCRRAATAPSQSKDSSDAGRGAQGQLECTAMDTELVTRCAQAMQSCHELHMPGFSSAHLMLQ